MEEVTIIESGTVQYKRWSLYIIFSYKVRFCLYHGIDTSNIFERTIHPINDMDVTGAVWFGQKIKQMHCHEILF